MLDKHLRPIIDPPLNLAGASVARLGLTADQVTFIGFVIGCFAVPALWAQLYWLALIFVGLNRLADGLDGAVARATAPSDRGGFLDISLDFVFYASIPMGFALADPANNSLPAVLLLFSFIGTGTSFLAFAIQAEKKGLKTQAQGKKSFYYLEGIAEGTETIAFFVICCLFPAWFPMLACCFAAICIATTAIRIHRGWTSF